MLFLIDDSSSKQYYDTEIKDYINKLLEIQVIIITMVFILKLLYFIFFTLSDF